jgi:hypothetical protein
LGFFLFTFFYISTAKRNKLTTLQFYSYILAVRDKTFSLLHSAGKLFHQYAVDAYTKIEANRLNYIKQNQTELRADLFTGIMDYLRETIDGVKEKIGKAFVLPSSFAGSIRNMMQLFQDAMSVVSKYGKPDLFVTFTCNPKWREITESLSPGQSPDQRPDLIARVFKIKLKRFLNDITKNHVFGVPVAHIHVIEFQVIVKIYFQFL